MSLDRRRRELADELSAELDDDVVVDYWRTGFDYFADLASCPSIGQLVLLSPRVEVLETTYEGTVDFGTVIEHQVAAYAVARSAGVVVPQVRRSAHRSATTCGRSYLLLDRLDDDEVWDQEVERDLGSMVRRLHGAEVGGWDQASITWASRVSDRLAQRLDAARVHAPVPTTEAVLAALEAELAGRNPAEDERLLHLDIRPSNVCVAGSAVTGLIDFANSSLGDPLFELARVRFNSLLTDAFLDGYGIADIAGWRRDHERLLALYELDVAALLVTVGAEEARDSTLTSYASGRLAELADVALGSGWRA